MRKISQLLVLVGVSLAVGTASAGGICVPTAEDARIASAVVQELKARYAGSPYGSQRSLRAGMRPHCRGDFTIHIYEVTKPEELWAVEMLVREAQASVPKASDVTLRFFEREVWIRTEGGGGYRGKEKLVRTVTVQSPRREGAPKREG